MIAAHRSWLPAFPQPFDTPLGQRRRALAQGRGQRQQPRTQTLQGMAQGHGAQGIVCEQGQDLPCAYAGRPQLRAHGLHPLRQRPRRDRLPGMNQQLTQSRHPQRISDTKTASQAVFSGSLKRLRNSRPASHRCHSHHRSAADC